MNTHEEGNDEIKQAYISLSDAGDRLIGYTEMLLPRDKSQTLDFLLFEMVKLNSECVECAINAPIAFMKLWRSG